jgi:hypothetical protein
MQAPQHGWMEGRECGPKSAAGRIRAVPSGMERWTLASLSAVILRACENNLKLRSGGFPARRVNLQGIFRGSPAIRHFTSSFMQCRKG